jgi:hypothetical protein
LQRRPHDCRTNLLSYSATARIKRTLRKDAAGAILYAAEKGPKWL